MGNPRLEEFEAAWRQLREVVERARTGSASRDELVEAIDRAVRTRTHSRETLAEMRGGYWGGDQVLFQHEVAVGALARELDDFVRSWTPDGGGRTVEQLLSAVDPLIVPPGSYEAHELP